MAITTIQKIIQIGSSKGGIYPAKALKELGVDVGDEVRVSIEALPKKTNHDELVSDYNKFVEEYGQTLKNLAER